MMYVNKIKSQDYFCLLFSPHFQQYPDATQPALHD
jgi:hypothetical protein